MTTMTRLLAAAAACLLSTAAQAAVTLNVQGGILMGASGVEIAGQRYDVAFVDQSCTTAFARCASASFAFRSEAAARVAGQALLDQVFVGAYDTAPNLTNGCTSSDGVCGTYIPFGIPADIDPGMIDDEVYVVTVENSNMAGTGVIQRTTLWFDDDLSGRTTQTYARFALSADAPVSPVPEPATWALMLTGFALTGAAMRRRRASVTRVIA